MPVLPGSAIPARPWLPRQLPADIGSCRYLVRGEVTLLVGGAEGDEAGAPAAIPRLGALIRALHAGQRLSAAEIAQLLGLKRSQVYQQLLDEKASDRQ